MFDEYGSITRLFLKKKDDGFTFAYITYQSIEEAKNAVETLNRKKVRGKIIKVQYGKEMNRNDSSDSRGYQDKTQYRNPKTGGEYPSKESETRKKFEERDSKYENKGREGRIRGFG
jgi:RNA recognition motif-containing protein